jgi:uncharacterized protein
MSQPADVSPFTVRKARWPAAAYVMVGVPALAVIASFVTLGLAIHGRDTTFPATFNWEGTPFDRDVERTARAQALGVHATLALEADGGRCTGTLAIDGALPAALHVQLTHATRSQLDQSLVLTRRGDRYSGACAAPVDGHWYVSVSDPAETWRVRREFDGALGVVDLRSDP